MFTITTLSAAVDRSPVIALVCLVTVVLVVLVAGAFAADVFVGMAERDQQAARR